MPLNVPVLNRLVLQLNAAYEPVAIISAKRALTLVFGGKAVVEEVSAHVVRTSKITIPLPNVIRLIRYRRVPRINRSVSRKGIILRDLSTCQYCGQKFPVGELTMDHVIPRSRGGGSTWENLVAACFECNNRKSQRTPAEAGMPLLKQPSRIGIHAKHRLMAGDSVVWDKYLFV
jgi:5-methylcytosine-specific restriction endonuclease McrA